MSELGEFGDQTFKQKPDQSMIWFRCSDRVNAAAPKPEEFNPFVDVRFTELPPYWQKWVSDQSDRYETRQTVPEFEKRFGRNRGSLTNPVLYDPLIPVKQVDGKIDWNDPNIRSPKMVEKVTINYGLFNNLISQAAVHAGLSWTTEPLNSEYGLYPETEEDLGTKTPLLDPKKNEGQGLNILHQNSWINYKGKAVKVTNFRGFACGTGPGEKPWFFTELAHRQKKQEPIVILVTATQGKGKTYLAIRLAEIFDKRFDVEKQVAMERSQITRLVSGRGKLKRNQCIVIDESQFGANARSWGNKDQQALMNFLAAARFYGYIIIIVALHRSMLDSIIRERIINFHIHMEARGLATVYQPRHQRFDEKNYPRRKGKLRVQLPDYDECDFITCLDCKSKENGTCNTIRARYERGKTEFVQTEAEKRDALEQTLATRDMKEDELAEMLKVHVKDMTLTSKGYYEPEDIKRILKTEYGIEVGSKKAVRIRVNLMRIAPPSTRVLA